MDFFTTFHGKNTCVVVGDTTKRLASHASLQCPFSNRILAQKQLPDFAEGNVDGIKLFFVSSEEVISNTEFHNLLHQAHLKENSITINSFPTLQV